MYLTVLSNFRRNNIHNYTGPGQFSFLEGSYIWGYEHIIIMINPSGGLEGRIRVMHSLYMHQYQ